MLTIANANKHTAIPIKPYVIAILPFFTLLGSPWEVAMLTPPIITIITATIATIPNTAFNAVATPELIFFVAPVPLAALLIWF